jgi:hypothetical protein
LPIQEATLLALRLFEFAIGAKWLELLMGNANLPIGGLRSDDCHMDRPLLLRIQLDGFTEEYGELLDFSNSDWA